MKWVQREEGLEGGRALDRKGWRVEGKDSWREGW